MENYKDLYEIEKRQRLNVEKTMKEIVNGLCLSAYTIAEDSKMQMLKTDVQRIQQEIARLEATKQERLQQHLMSVGGMIQQMTGTVIGSAATGLNVSSSFSVSQSAPQRATKVQAGSAQTQQGGRVLQNFNIVANGTSAAQGASFQKSKASTVQGRGRRKRVSEEVARPKSAFTPQQPPNVVSVVSAAPAADRQSMKRPASTLPSVAPPIFATHPTVEAPTVEQAPVLKSSAMGPSGDESMVEMADTPMLDESADMDVDQLSKQPAVDEQKSQVEEDGMFTVGTVPAKEIEKKNKYFCEYCETESVDEPSTIVHVWSHVNEIRHTHAFECVVAGCLFKTNATKEALAHKKNAHTAEDECKILDRRDTLAEYFKHCVSKYFIHLDDDAKSRIFESRHV